MIIVHTRAVRLISACAVTVWPFIFADPAVRADSTTLTKHEPTHGKQQLEAIASGLLGSVVALLLWWSTGSAYYWHTAIELPFAGLALWYTLYLLCLPVRWNCWRRRWETEAYRAEGIYTDAQIAEILRGAPYWLS